jgi:integrase
MAQSSQSVEPPRNPGRFSSEVEQNPELVTPSDYLNPVEVKALEILQRKNKVRPRLSAALDMYLGTRGDDLDAKAVERSRRDWGLLVEIAGDICLEDLGREHARMYVAHCLSKGLKPTTARRALNTVSAIFSLAIKEFDLRDPIRPFSDVSVPSLKTYKSEVKTPSAEELGEILSTFRDDTSGLGLVILIQMGTGCRVGEVSGLATADVVLDAEVPYLKIQEHPWRRLKTKTSARDVPLVGFALDAARAAVTRANSSQALFPGYARPRGADSASGAVNKRLNRWAIGSHGFRHGMKDLLREAGCPEPIQKEIQGHAGDGISSGYGKGYSLKVKQDWLTKAHALITINTKQD